MAKGKSLLLGFMIGGTISATFALLSAPTSGKHIRKRIKQQSDEWIDMLMNLTSDSLRLKNQLAKTSKEGTALIKRLTEEMKKSVKEWKVAVEPHQENIYDYLEQIESSLKELEEKVKNNK